MTLFLCLGVVGAPSARAGGGSTSIGGQTTKQRDAFELNARDGEREKQEHESLQGRPEYLLKEYRRAPMCDVSGPHLTTSLNGECPPAAGIVHAECGEDTVVHPLWMRERADVSSPWSRWNPVSFGGCGVDLLPVLTAEDFARLPLPAPALTMQPDRGWVLINVETIVWTDPAPVTLRTELLGYGITVEAIPDRWIYDFGDGHDLVTLSPGTPYPDHDVFHVYEEPHDEVAITLSTEWTGRYQVDGSPVWRDVAGVAVTSTTSAPFSVQERRARLVSGLCTDRPRPPDC